LKKGIGTRAVHSGERIDRETASVTQAIHQSSTYAFPSVEEMERVFRGESSAYIYTRYANPTSRSVEEKLAELEGCEEGVLFSSGMSAMATVFLAFCHPGSHLVVSKDVYGGTFQLAADIIRDQLGLDTRFVDANDAGGLEAALDGEPSLVCVESPTNPLLRVIDLEKTAEMVHEAGAMLVVDNTFATPVNQNPARFGADIVLHSASKYLGGHSDLIAGAVAGKSETMEVVRKTLRLLGGCIDPHAAWLLGRSMKTLPLRVRRQNDNALAVARYLDEHPKVGAVYYPGLPGHPEHELAAKQMTGFGGVLSFELSGGAAALAALTPRLQLTVLAPSLGGVDSLMMPPAISSHISVPKEVREQSGISDGLLRVAVGIEDTEDLLGDFEQALEGV
jgi:cystathionine beta-lyase/cystathionine gamma-synthase